MLSHNIEAIKLSENTTQPLVCTVEEAVEEVEAESTTFRVTAFCSCEKCCGEWANNRPVDENGQPIVYGASGEQLVDWYSCASPLEFGTQIELDGIGVVEVHDRTAQWVVNKYGSNLIDIYMNDHQQALEFGVKYVEGVIK